MPDYRQFMPGPMARVPFMPAAQVGPQQIQLGGMARPPMAPPPGPVPNQLGNRPNPTPWAAFGGGYRPPMGGGQTGGPTPWGGVNAGLPAQPAPSINIHGGFGAGYQTPMQAPVTQARPFNGPMANLGLGIMGAGKQGMSFGQMMPQMMPQIMSMLKARG